MKQSLKSLFEVSLNKKYRSSYKIDKGITNESYAINDAYVLRLPKENRDETISFKNEENIYKAIEPLNISEKILFFNIKTGVKITKFVHGAREYTNTLNNEQITLVAKALKKLHKSNISVDFGYQIFNKLKVYKESLSTELYADEKIEKQVIDNIKKIFKKDKMVLCHNDLVQNNLLFKDNKVVLIDWEYGAMNNPYFDLASFIGENNLNKEQALFFLNKYFGSKLNLTRKKRVKIFLDFNNLLMYYWGLYYFKKRGDRIYSTIAFDKLEKLMSSNKFSLD